MALVTVQRSPSVRADPQDPNESDAVTDSVDEEDGSRNTKSLSECYFANKGAALVLPATERSGAGTRRLSPVPAPPVPLTQPAHPASPQHAAQPAPPTQPDIQHHLQSMFYLLRPEETLKMAVKLESAHPGRTRYLVVVCRNEEAVLLGIDCNERTTVGLVLRVLADTSIKLDGDGGFSVCVCGRQHIFKPVSVQAMWSALQTLHRASSRARAHNHFAGGASHGWASYYEERVHSDRSCLNEWHAMDCLESRRPPSPDSLRHKPCEREETEKLIRCTLKDIMMTVDLDEVTSKVIRGRLEEELDMDLGEFKSFIDKEMLNILGQMDAPTEIFDHVYLGSEWNASNLEELQRNGVRHILNVTREIDNFFPGMFDYLNVRVYDDEKTDLLKHWDNTFKYITKARKEGSKVLVHCKMGVSRSASVVIAYAMKAYNWNFDRALKHVKEKRNCIKPNTSFLTQLETYQGILDAMKNREKLQRSKSETNLKSPGMVSKTESKVMEPTPLIQALSGSCGGRPRSWSPDTKLASELLPPTSVSLENLVAETRHMLMPCANGSYSVSPNQIMRLKEEGPTSVKHIVNELESAVAGDKKVSHRRSLRLNFGNLQEPTSVQIDAIKQTEEQTVKLAQDSPPKNLSNKSSLHAHHQKDKTHTWDPGEKTSPKPDDQVTIESDIAKCDSGIIDINIKIKADDTLFNQTERVFEQDEAAVPSRQSSWSSFDSAVVPDLSRNSSWGSYDTRSVKSQIQADLSHTGTVKKTKQRLEEATVRREEDPASDKSTCDTSVVQHKASSDLSIISENNELSSQNSKPVKLRSEISDNERKFNETCAILKDLAYNSEESCGSSRSEPYSCYSRLSASAPTDSWLRAVDRQLRPASASYGDLPSAPPFTPAAYRAAVSRAARNTSGLVKNLKMEFEARSNTSQSRSDQDSFEQDAEPLRKTSKLKNQSLPQIVEKKTSPMSSVDSSEDLSVKVLVDKYDSHLCKSKCASSCDSKSGRNSLEQLAKKSKLSTDGDGSSRTSPFLRNSFCGVIRSAGSSDRPPMAPNVVSMAPINYPNVVMATVMSKAQTKKQLQHGKTHPLTRLNLNRSNNRCSNPVYNTM